MSIPEEWNESFEHRDGFLVDFLFGHVIILKMNLHIEVVF